MIKYVTEKQIKKYKLEAIKCEKCGKMLAEGYGCISKHCPECKHENYVIIT